MGYVYKPPGTGRSERPYPKSVKMPGKYIPASSRLHPPEACLDREGLKEAVTTPELMPGTSCRFSAPPGRLSRGLRCMFPLHGLAGPVREHYPGQFSSCCYGAAGFPNTVLFSFAFRAPVVVKTLPIFAVGLRLLKSAAFGATRKFRR